MKYVLNHNLLLTDREKDTIVLYDSITDKVYTLSVIEYELINMFSKTNSIQQIQDVYEFDKRDIASLIRLSITSEILIKTTSNTQKKYTSTIVEKIMYIFGLLSNSKRVIWPLQFSSRLYRVFEIDIQNSFVDRFFNSYKKYFIILLLVFFFSSINFGILEFLESSKLLTIALFLLVTSLFHEVGHFFVYKIFKGKSTFVCFGFLNIVFPVLYLKFFSVNLPSFKKNRLKTILISLGGTVFDLYIVLLLFYVDSHVLFQNIMVFRLLFNLNFLLVGTDGYYIMKDVLPNNYIHRMLEKPVILWEYVGLWGIKILNTCFYLWLVMYLFVFQSRIL